MAECYTHHGSSCKGDCDPKNEQIASLRAQLAAMENNWRSESERAYALGRELAEAREKLAKANVVIEAARAGARFSQEPEELWQALKKFDALPAPAAEGEKPCEPCPKCKFKVCACDPDLYPGYNVGI